MRKYIIGFVVGLLVASAAPVYAQEVTAIFSKFVFKVNGEEKPLEADPLVYQGSTYLPVRTVANILGFDVTYKADSRTIELNNVEVSDPMQLGESIQTETPAENQIQTELEKVTVRLSEVNKLIYEYIQRDSQYKFNLIAQPDNKDAIQKMIEENDAAIKPIVEEREQLEAKKAELEAQLQTQ